ncbi:hypothetical protein QUA07_28845 [Microcoleus sp. T3_A4]|uniref:plasmid replication protein, CyRepA1 family n=1 Tax=Microcoleus sp. T3_A4 TaxID=2818968 RepID=UPI002FD05F7A
MISEKFDIRNHLERLEPAKAKNFYTCPVCEGHRLGVDPKTGKFQCWSGGCSTADIREAIRPLSEFLAEVKGDRPARQARKPKAQKKEYPPAPIPIGAKLLRLPAPGKLPRAERPRYFPQGVPSNAAQITYRYSNTQEVKRFEWPEPTHPKGRDKTYRQVHTDFNGKQIWKKGDARWPAYQINEVVELLKNIPDGEPVVVLTLEGEPNVELGRLHSIAALTVQGSAWSHPEIQIMLETLRATGKNVSIAMLRDNDAAGIKKGQEVWLVARHIQFPCIVIDPRKIYPDIPEAGDIKEILEAIGADEFLNRVNAEIAAQAQNPEPLPALEKALPFEPDTKYTQLLRRWKKRRQYTPTVRCNLEFVKLPEPGPNTITAIKAGLGRGKTQWLAWLTAVCTLGKFFLLGHRNALLRGTSERCNFYHIQFDEGWKMLSDPDGRIASCVDSLLRFLDDSADYNCTIILDEVESVVRHILTSRTISASDRIAILEKFTRLLSSASRIILLDGHLTDATVAYIASLAPGKEVTKYENTFKATLPKVEIFKGSGAPLKASQIEAFKNLILKADRPAVFCDSKNDGIALCRQLEEVHGAGTGLLLTADNSTEDLQAEFIKNPSESISSHKWSFIVATPLLQDGVDISIPDYFSEVFGMFGGVVTVNSVCQMVRRVRHPIGGIKILCAARGLPLRDGGELYAARFQKLMADRMAADISEFDERPLEDIQAEIYEEAKRCLHERAWIDLKILENIEQPYFYDFVCELLRESGHEVLELDIESAETQKHKQVKEEVKEEYAEAVAMAEIIPIAEAEKILKRQNHKKVTEADIRAANRAIIADQLPGIEITGALVLRLKKDNKLLPAMRNLWEFQNPDKAKQLRGYKYEEGKLKVFGSDHRLNPQILRALQKLDIGKFLVEGDRTFCNDSPEVLAVAKWGEGKEAATLDLKIKNQSNIQYLQSLLAHLGGVKLVKAQTQKKGQQREYRYRPEGGSLPADFNELYAAVSSKMLQKWEEKVQKKESEKRSSVSAGTVDSTSVELVAPLPDILYNNAARGATEIEEDLEATICQTEVATTSPELPAELPEPEAPIANWTGWVNRWGKWCEARVLGWCEAGTQYKVQFLQASGELGEMLVFPEKFHPA